MFENAPSPILQAILLSKHSLDGGTCQVFARSHIYAMIFLWHGKDQLFVFINVSVEGERVRDPNRFFVFFSSGVPPHMGSRERFFPGASNGDIILST